MIINYDKYLYLMNTKLKFYNYLLNMIRNANDIYQIVFTELSIDFAFPGCKLDKDLLQILLLEIDALTREIEIYQQIDQETKEFVINNQCESLEKEVNRINEFMKALGIQKVAVENDYDRINMMKNPNNDHISELIDIRVKTIKDNVKERRM